MTAGIDGSSSATPDDSNSGSSEQWDLTPLVAPYLDRHMVLPLLEFLKERVDAGGLRYSHADLDRARLELVRPTHMVDFAEDLYKSLHKGSANEEAAIPSKELEEQKQAVYKEKERLEAACAKLDTFPAEERLKLIAANKWNVPHLAGSLGIGADVVERYRELARFNFECGDYKAAVDILSNYISLFAVPPPPAPDDDDEFADGPAGGANATSQGRHAQAQQSSSNATYPDGTVAGNANMYYLKAVDANMLQVLWGRLACEILMEEYAAAAVGLEAVKAALEALVASHAVSALEALQQRTWLMHWSLFVYWNDTAAPVSAPPPAAPAPVPTGGKKGAAAAAAAAAAAQAGAGGLEQLVELFHSERYRQAITTNAPHLLRYLTAAVLLCKRRVVGKKATSAHSAEARRLLKNLVYVIQDCEYTDPIVEFVNCLIVKFDFDSAQVKLGECERVLSNDFFLCHQTDLFMEEARVFVFENYCRIHTKIDLRALGEKLAMDQEQAERWIVDLIRNADLDAKIDADQGCVVMGGAPQSIYEQVMDRTRDLNLRSATLTQNLSRMLNEARKEKAKRERAAKMDTEEY